MSSKNPIFESTSLPNGAVFHRCALQVNPHHYGSTFRGAKTKGNADDHAREIVQKARELGVSVLAITDHNDVSGVSAFRRAAGRTGIHIFPGFEISSREGVHVLCIYPEETDDDKLGRYLGEFGIREPQPSSDLSERNFADILRQVVKSQGGVAIAAHVTNQKGLFKSLTGQARIQAWQSEELLAIQIPGLVEDLPPDERQIVENKNPDYRREHPADDDLAVAVVNAGDVTSAEQLEDRSATCWIKMSTVSIDGLRQAFFDPGSRIRLNRGDGSPETEDHSELIALSWEGGFLDGASIRFNPNLNVLVGGRGTGKSTVVESIRSVLGAEPIGEDARKAHDGIVRQVLKSGTKVSLLVRANRPASRDYLIERTIPNPPLVRDDQGQVSNLSPAEIMPRVEVFGQHEISELTKSREKLTRLLHRFVEPDNSLSVRTVNVRRELKKNRNSVLEARNDRLEIQDRLASLPGLEETLERFKEAGLEDRLKEQSLLVREERVLDSIPARMAPFHSCMESLRTEIPIDLIFLSDKALQDLPGREILVGAREALAELERELERVANSLERAVDRAERSLSDVRDEWLVRKNEVQAEYEKILRELQRSRVDGEEFIRLRREIEDLRPLRERRTLVRRLETELSDRRRDLLAEWEDLKADEFRRLDRAAKKVNQALRQRVQVEVTAAGDREPLFKVLREEIGGRLSEVIDALRARQDFSLTHFVESCRQGGATLEKEYSFPPSQAKRLAEAEPGVLMRIEELRLPATTDIRLNLALPGEPPAWQLLKDLSTGQKATAVLLLLLLESDSPLIVDQPEDDLDNRFITDGIVPRMREEKQSRQFIFSTHNANIPVLGDAELIVGLTASGEAEYGQARIANEHIGSIDDATVRELVEEILEGGKEAFERRRRKYGF